MEALPFDVMENIFLRYSEVVGRSPMLLTHVCRLWRQVALRSGRLWRNIILSPPERAKHHMKLSQGCLLRVAWFKWTYKIKTPPDFSWIQPYSPRFEELLLVHQPDSIAAVLDSLGPLPQLLNLTIIAPEDNLFHHSLSISFSQAKLISVDMPSLQILVLTSIHICLQHLMDIFRDCRLLLEAEILDVGFIDLDKIPQHLSLVHTPQLRVLVLRGILDVAQEYLLSRLILPAGCSLCISECTINLVPYSKVPPSVISMLQPIQFQSMGMHHVFFRLQEEGNRTRCNMTLERYNPSSGHLLPIWRDFDLSSIRRLEVDGMQGDDQGWNTLYSNMTSLEELRIHKRIFPFMLPLTAFSVCHCPLLRSLHLHNVTLGSQDDPILPSLIITLHFVSLRRDTGRPLKHIKLDNCKYTEGDLAALQTVAYDALEVNCLG